jgi:1-acyl-sn-glycerol-3-phosphate acyltransferase
MNTATIKHPGNQFGACLALALRVGASFLVMTVGALLLFCVALLTGFRLRRFYSEHIAAPIGKALLRIFAVRFVVHATGPWPERQVIYISNHTSTIDMFVLIALQLPNARFFLSGYLRKLPPLALIGYLIGIFWTVPQAFPERRRAIFKRAARLLKHTGESVYLSPEGERVVNGRIGHFNKGAFHLATDLRAPIVPMFIAIPRGIDPGKGLDARPGTVHVYVGAPIDTSHWCLEDLERNRDQVRSRYERWHAELNKC